MEGTGQKDIGELLQTGCGVLGSGFDMLCEDPQLMTKLFVDATLRGDFSSAPILAGNYADGMKPAGEIQIVPAEPCLIIANHHPLLKMVRAISHHIRPECELPFVFADIGDAVRTMNQIPTFDPRHKISEIYVQLLATHPRIIASIGPEHKENEHEIRRIVERLTSGRGKIYNLREIMELAKNTGNSFLLFIEGEANRGTTILPPKPHLVFLANLIAKQRQIVFLGHNPWNQRTVVKSYEGKKLKSEDYLAYLTEVFTATLAQDA